MRRTITLAALGAVVLLAGCGGDDEPASKTDTTTKTTAATQPRTTVAKPPKSDSKQPNAGGFDVTQTIPAEPPSKRGGPPPDKACIAIVASVKLSGDVSEKAATAEKAEKKLGTVVDKAAGSSGPLHELALAHVLLAQLYGGAAASADQAQKLKQAIIALEGRTPRLAAGADAPSCALGKSIYDG